MDTTLSSSKQCLSRSTLKDQRSEKQIMFLAKRFTIQVFSLGRRSIEFSLRSWLATVVFTALLIGCSEDSSRSAPTLSFVEGEVQDFRNFGGFCGSNFDDVQRFYLRGLFKGFYFWSEDIVDIDPRTALFSDFSDYFDYLVTDDLSPTGSGRLKDRFSFFTSQSVLDDLLESGIEIGYGVRLSFPQEDFGGSPRIGFVIAGTNADIAGIERGDTILSADGFTSASRNEFLSRLFPSTTGSTVTLEVRKADNSVQSINLTSQQFSVPGVAQTQTIPLSNDRLAGYIQFNDHTSIALDEITNAVTQLAQDNIDELIIDLRYNSGGFLFVANRLTSMIAPRIEKEADGAFFERLIIANPNNFLFPSEETIDFEPINNSNPLPELELNRVYMLTGPDTCSASESVMNALRGINVEVIQIGGTTCGKPFGFVSFDNCGFSFLPVLFESVNSMNQGGYSDGFRPANANGFGVPLPGCSVADDFGNSLGSTDEALLAAAIFYIENSTCPPTLQTFTNSISQLSSAGTQASQQTGIPFLSPGHIRALNGLKVIESAQEKR